MPNHAPPLAQDHAPADRAVYDVLLAELHAHGHELYPGVRDRDGLAKAVGSVAKVLRALAAGATLHDALEAQEKEDTGLEQGPLTRDQILDLRCLAAEGQQADTDVLRQLRSRRQQVLARAVDRAGSERLLNTFEATFEGSQRANAELITWYDLLLNQGVSRGEAPAA